MDYRALAPINKVVGSERSLPALGWERVEVLITRKKKLKAKINMKIFYLRSNFHRLF